MNTARSIICAASALLIAGCETHHDRYGYPNGAYTPPGTTPGSQVISSGPYDSGAAPPSRTDVAAPGTPYNPYIATTPQYMTDADRAVAEQVRVRSERYARGGNVVIYNRGGTVTLTGTVANDADRTALVNAARTTPGVVAVNDQLQVTGTSTSAPTGRYDAERVYAPGSPSDFFSLHVRGLNDTDRVLGQRILEGLRADTVLPTLMPVVNIDVSEGRVTVRGTVQSHEQKREILSAVQRAAGTNNVYDELQVVAPR